MVDRILQVYAQIYLQNIKVFHDLLTNGSPISYTAI